MLTLSVEKRTEDKAPALRRAGKIPAVVYGGHHEATSVAVDAGAFEKVFREAGEASVISLEGLGAAIPALVHEVDLDPLTSNPRHIDFYAITKGEKVEVAIPIAFVGEAPAIKAGANLVKVLHEIEVEADPMHLPHEVSVDLSGLQNIDDQIRAKDINLPAGVTLITDPEEVVILVQEVEVEKEEEAVEPEADIASVEVEQKGKEKEQEQEQ